jgi:hypothetical protein
MHHHPHPIFKMVVTHTQKRDTIPAEPVAIAIAAAFIVILVKPIAKARAKARAKATARANHHLPMLLSVVERADAFVSRA